MKPREGNIPSPEAEPTAQEWEMLRDKIAELWQRFVDFKTMIVREKELGPANNHFINLGNTIKAAELIVIPNKQGEPSTKENFDTAMEFALLFEKYLNMLDSHDDFREKELMASGAYPDIQQEFEEKTKAKQTAHQYFEEFYLDESVRRLSQEDLGR